MRNIRTCSHIKTNGTKCGSPALRQTLCYFHYQWDRRERRRVRLGGPVGTNKNTGIDFPILEGPASIMIALMEVQHALLDARIDRLTAHTLLYSLQLGMQLKISTFTGLSSRLQSVSTCPELEADLDLSAPAASAPPKKPAPPARTSTLARTPYPAPALIFVLLSAAKHHFQLHCPQLQPSFILRFPRSSVLRLPPRRHPDRSRAATERRDLHSLLGPPT